VEIDGNVPLEIIRWSGRGGIPPDKWRWKKGASRSALRVVRTSVLFDDRTKEKTKEAYFENSVLTGGGAPKTCVDTVARLMTAVGVGEGAIPIDCPSREDSAPRRVIFTVFHRKRMTTCEKRNLTPRWTVRLS
jgi:hypothetical protein